MAEKEDFKKLVQRMVYSNLANAGEICRLRCFEQTPESDPNLLDSIAAGIMEFLNDGDIFDQVVETMLEADPAYFGRRLASANEEARKTIAGTVVAEMIGKSNAFVGEVVFLSPEDAQELNERFEQALKEGTGPFEFPPKKEKEVKH